MALQTITGKLTKPDGSAVRGSFLRLTLTAPGTIPGTEEVLAAAVEIAPKVSDGTYTVSVISNADITNPAGTSYKVQEFFGPQDNNPFTYTIVVPNTGGPFIMSNLVGVVPALTPGPAHVGSLTVDGAATFSAGPVTIGGTLGVTGLASFAGGITVSAGPVTLPVASIADEALSENVALLNESNVFSAAQVFPVASIADEALSENVALLNEVNTFSASPIVTSGTGWTIDANGNLAVRSVSVQSNGPNTPDPLTANGAILALGGLFYVAPRGGGLDDGPNLAAAVARGGKVHVL